MGAIRIDGVIKEFGAVRALDGVSLDIADGELFFLLGASGCGKTTLLRCIAGLEQPTSGRIWFGERDVTRLAPHKREAAMVFQSYALWPHMTVEKNVAFGLEQKKIPKAKIRELVAEALRMVHLGDMAGRGVDQLSGGQQQRVALARALVVRPKCLLLDEPLSNLDAKLRIEMRREIRRIVKEGGLTAVYVTHDQEEALEMADRLAVMRDGRIEQAGSPAQVYRRPHTAFVANFIGETNLLPATIREVGEASVTVESTSGLLHGCLADPTWLPTPGEKAEVSVRPEAWRMGGRGENIISGRVRGSSYRGSMVRYEVETAAGIQQVTELNPETIYGPDDGEIKLNARPGDVVVMQGPTT